MLQSMGSQRVRHDWVTELNYVPVDNLVVKEGICLSNVWLCAFWYTQRHCIFCPHCGQTENGTSSVHELWADVLLTVVQLWSHVRLFETPWTATLQLPLSSTVFQSSLKSMSIESMIIPNHSSSASLLCFAFIVSQHQSLFQWANGPILTSVHNYWKNHSWLDGSLSAKLCLCFLICCLGFAIAFLPRSKCLLISWLHSSSVVILEPKKIKSASTFSPSICCELMGLDAVIFISWMLSFKSAFSLSSFILIKRLFSSSLIPAIRMVSSAYLRLLIFLPATLIPACGWSSLAFHMMYSAKQLKIGRKYTALLYYIPNFEPVNFSMSGSNCCFFTSHIGFSGDR